MGIHRINELAKQGEMLRHLLQRPFSMADIGTDHGKLPLLLLKKGCVDRAVLSDIVIGPLENARGLFLANEQFSDRVQFVLAAGFQGVTEQVDVGFVCGMGGSTVNGILEDLFGGGGPVPPIFVIQPMKEHDRVRRKLLSSGYLILWDYFIVEGHHYYEVIVACRASLFDVFFGGNEAFFCSADSGTIPGGSGATGDYPRRPLSRVHEVAGYRVLEENLEVFGQYLEYRIKKMKRILAQLSGTGEHAEKIEYYRKMLLLLENAGSKGACGEKK